MLGLFLLAAMTASCALFDRAEPRPTASAVLAPTEARTTKVAALPLPQDLPWPALLWERNFDPGGTYVTGAAGSVLLSRDEGLLALDAQTGAERWRAPAGDGPILFGNDKVLTLNSSPSGPSCVLTTHDAATGRVLWEAPMECLSIHHALECGSQPVLFGGTMDGWAAVGLDPISKSERWRVKLPGAALPTSCDAEGLYIARLDEGTLVRYVVATGQESWRVKLSGYMNIPVNVGNNLVVVGEKSLRGLRASDGSESWFYSRGDSEPGYEESHDVRDGAILLLRPDSVNIIRATTGDVVRTWALPEPSPKWKPSRRLPGIAATRERIVVLWQSDVVAQGSYILIWEGSNATPRILGRQEDGEWSAIVGHVIVERTATSIRARSLLKTEPPPHSIPPQRPPAPPPTSTGKGGPPPPMLRRPPAPQGAVPPGE